MRLLLEYKLELIYFTASGIGGVRAISGPARFPAPEFLTGCHDPREFDPLALDRRCEEKLADVGSAWSLLRSGLYINPIYSESFAQGFLNSWHLASGCSPAAAEWLTAGVSVAYCADVVLRSMHQIAVSCASPTVSC